MKEYREYIGALKLIDRLQEKQEDDIDVLRHEVGAISKISQEEIDLLIDKLIKRRLISLKNNTVCYIPFIVEPIFKDNKEALLCSYIYGCYDIIKKQENKKKIILLIDTSCSIGETLLKELKSVLKDFLLDLLPYYDISIFSFADRVYHLTDFTSDEKLLISIIDNLHEKRGFIFAQALEDVVSYIKKTSRKAGEVVVILLTDGQIRRSVNLEKNSLKKISSEYKQLNITFYVVGVVGVFGVDRENLSLLTNDIYYLEIGKDLEEPFLELLKELKISYSYKKEEEGFKEIKKFIKERVEGMREGLEKVLQKILDYSFVVIDTPLFGIWCHYPEAGKNYFIPAFIRSSIDIIDSLTLKAQRLKDIIKEELNSQAPAITKTTYKEYPYLHLVSCFNQENIGVILGFLLKQEELSNFHLFYLSYLKRLISYQGVFLAKLILATRIAKLPCYIKEVLPTYKLPHILRSEATYILKEKELLEKYLNKYVAIRDAEFLKDESGRILAADTYDELLSLVKKRDNLLIKKVEEEKEKKQIKLPHMAY